MRKKFIYIFMILAVMLCLTSCITNLPYNNNPTAIQARKDFLRAAANDHDYCFGQNFINGAGLFIPSLTDSQFASLLSDMREKNQSQSDWGTFLGLIVTVSMFVIIYRNVRSIYRKKKNKTTET